LAIVGVNLSALFKLDDPFAQFPVGCGKDGVDDPGHRLARLLKKSGDTGE